MDLHVYTCKIIKFHFHLTFFLFQASAAEEISAMYQKEWKLKQVIYENVCHAISRDSVMFYTSAWVHQPYIEDRVELLLQSMLTETGHVS